MTVAETALAACGVQNLALKTFAIFEDCPELSSEMTMACSEVVCVKENEVAQMGILDL